ncbi:hypothetical protein Fmac_018264 [Flemingia macrophylla]|uniref:Uncharacterized protein n=1 Tax=Flemingia macrophylla TaxID=520843 RepID=A0ABD1M4H0_9FABA
MSRCRVVDVIGYFACLGFCYRHEAAIKVIPDHDSSICALIAYRHIVAAICVGLFALYFESVKPMDMWKRSQVQSIVWVVLVKSAGIACMWLSLVYSRMDPMITFDHAAILGMKKFVRPRFKQCAIGVEPISIVTCASHSDIWINMYMAFADDLDIFASRFCRLYVALLWKTDEEATMQGDIYCEDMAQNMADWFKRAPAMSFAKVPSDMFRFLHTRFSEVPSDMIRNTRHRARRNCLMNHKERDQANKGGKIRLKQAERHFAWAKFIRSATLKLKGYDFSTDIPSHSLSGYDIPAGDVETYGCAIQAMIFRPALALAMFIWPAVWKSSKLCYGY